MAMLMVGAYSCTGVHLLPTTKFEDVCFLHLSSFLLGILSLYRSLDQDVSSQLLLQHHACLPGVILPTMMAMYKPSEP
ncbi:hypothetical protein STEG23_037257, partial [Scotinomys teguina]